MAHPTGRPLCYLHHVTGRQPMRCDTSALPDARSPRPVPGGVRRPADCAPNALRGVSGRRADSPLPHLIGRLLGGCLHLSPLVVLWEDPAHSGTGTAGMAAETITVVFTDLVGSTELLSRVGEARADELRREHFGLLRTAVARARRSGGQEPRRRPDGGLRRGRRRRWMRRSRCSRRSRPDRRDAEPLSIKIGVAVGDAEVEDDDYFGLPVVEAARLCAKAQGGEILDDRVRAHAGQVAQRGGARVGRRAGVEGSRRAGGDLPGAVGADRGRRASGRRCRRGWRRRCRRTSSAATAEVEQLAAAWKAIAAEGERRVMLLSGEPGIGKTTLSAALRLRGLRRGRRGGVRPLRRGPRDPVPAVDRGAHPGRARTRREPVLAAHVADRGGHLARLVPELAAAAVRSRSRPGGDADTERFVLFGCVVDLLARGVGRVPGAGGARRSALGRPRRACSCCATSSRATRPMRVGVLGTFRDSDITTDHPLADFLAALHRENRGVRIALRGLRRRRPAPPAGDHRRARDGRRTASRCATRCWPRPRGTRSSWPRSCATSPRPARSTSKTTAAGSPTPTCARSGSRSACARWSAGASPGSAPTPNGSSGSAR